MFFVEKNRDFENLHDNSSKNDLDLTQKKNLNEFRDGRYWFLEKQGFWELTFVYAILNLSKYDFINIVLHESCKYEYLEWVLVWESCIPIFVNFLKDFSDLCTLSCNHIFLTPEEQ